MNTDDLAATTIPEPVLSELVQRFVQRFGRLPRGDELVRYERSHSSLQMGLPALRRPGLR